MDHKIANDYIFTVADIGRTVVGFSEVDDRQKSFYLVCGVTPAGNPKLQKFQRTLVQERFGMRIVPRDVSFETPIVARKNREWGGYYISRLGIVIYGWYQPEIHYHVPN